MQALKSWTPRFHSSDKVLEVGPDTHITVLFHSEEVSDLFTIRVDLSGVNFVTFPLSDISLKND